MGLSYKIRRADRFLEELNEADRSLLVRCCHEIQIAQEQLNQTCAEAFHDCISRCQGKCCKNIHAEDIVTTLDFLYILILNRDLLPQALECVADETLFSADCPFLRGGVGPCLFAEDQKPERCVITFCSVVPSARRPVRRVRSAFTRLWWHVFYCRPFFWIGW